METYWNKKGKTGDLAYHGEKWKISFNSGHLDMTSYYTWDWEKITDKYDTPEEAQSAIDEYREQKRRDKHHKVVGEIF